MSNPLSPSSSRLSKPNASRTPPVKNARHRRSKSNLPQPKILPFPDLSELRSSRDTSRANSPLSTPAGDRLDITFDQLIMVRGNSSDSGTHTRQRSSGSGGRTTPVSVSGTSTFLRPTSPPTSSPLAVTSSRARAFTAPTRPPLSPASRSMLVSSSATTTSRDIQDPHLASSSPPRPSTSAPSAPSLAIAPPIAPILLTPSSSGPASSNHAVDFAHGPTTPVKTSHHHNHGYGRSHVLNHSTSSLLSAPTTSVTPVPSFQSISEHLYKAFLSGTCADVRLVVKKWGVHYNVHKMILSQSSFFSSLFLGGFSEATATPKSSYKGKGKARVDVQAEDWHGETIDLQFDDPNITRAAFEICLSRLYCSFPSLHFPTTLLPTSSHPLTPSFPYIASPPPYPSLQSSLPPNAQLATPRLLLSLLATSVYIGHGHLLREVLAMILRTVGPLTVNQYLAFAIGDGIGDEEWEGQTAEGASGLQDVAKRIPDAPESRSSTMTPMEEEDEETFEISEKSSGSRLSSDSNTKIGQRDPFIQLNGVPYEPSSTSSAASVRSQHNGFSFASADMLDLPHFYGTVGNKIGEACVCWLARWGMDLLRAELETPNVCYRVWAHGGLPAPFVRALLSSDFFFVKDEMERYEITRDVLELRRTGWQKELDGRGDLSLADPEVAEGHGWEEWEEDEKEIKLVFAEGIRYCHMTFNDLSSIASNIDPQTALPYAPMSVLQAAHWSAADLRARVTAHERDGNVLVESEDDKNELGLTQTTSFIVEGLRKRRRPAPRSRVPSPAASWGRSTTSLAATINSISSATDISFSPLSSHSHSVWYPVPSDETHRIGASGLLSAGSLSTANLSGVPDFGPDLVDVLPQEGSKSKPPHGEKNFFGLVSGKATEEEIEEKWVNEGGAFAMSHLGLMGNGNAKEDKWTKIEPFRFSVEFWDVDKLGEKERYYSATHFYAGSLFNCYVQMIKRKEKGVQLGIYLHRQSPNESFPTPSAPQMADRNPLMRTVTSLSTAPAPSTPAVHGQSLAPSPVIPGSPPSTTARFFPGGASQERGNALATDVPYHDTRAVTKAFFSISCASALGTALIRFTSGPDSFAHSQSWGWKSSALKSEEYLSSPPAVERGENLDEGVMGWTGEVDTEGIGKGNGRSTLRATVVVGIV
ncbi:hypothetical protein AYX15_03448 [Cryptococcus neoformans]|nr:hypothetical protein AYX15_03448 [Cryptococcus neoformans var. grubii]